MKIEQSAVAMNSSHSYSSEYEFAVASAISFRQVFAGVDASLEPAADISTRSDADRQAQLLVMLQELIGRMLEFLSGQDSSSDSSTILAAESPGLPARGVGARAPRLVMEWSRVSTERIEEHESSDFSSTGQIKTSDGRTLDFSLGLSMCRDYSCERASVEGGSIELRDPLVINFGGRAADLEGKSFTFDLDADGSAESVHELAGGSGYLAIDRNGDGCVNDGSELFGTCSGDGFADLAKLDSDGNRWLDEADAAFSTLRVWQRDESGQDSLATLAGSGVGALYLGSAATPFALTDDENRLRGQIRASGIYLNEDGSAGSLQQIDLAV